uniref:Uncharacterized protein LOC111130584 n=1 Tax=Crassostrea virginica TaxID=6565 RepID=A0A8B8DYX3_CRAVI|nr:uncharacterized protein LOC111130584 [Crassostrea virginica]
MESKVKQRTKEWFDIRKSVFLTSSKFGDALGVGLGKPYDFFLSLISESTDEEDEEEEVESTYTKHGQTMEEIILECHQLLTGFRTRETGFWMSKDRILQDLIGTSPDAVVIDDHKKDIGLCEFKAPIYRMYRKENSVHGIPRHYMAQIQGQLAITGLPWCNFLAVCKNSKEIMLKKVYFHSEYWNNAVKILKQFCYALQDAKLRKELGYDPLDFEGARQLETWPVQIDYLPGELSIEVDDLIQIDKRGRFSGPSKVWLSFDFLIGQSYSLPPRLQEYAKKMILDVDEQISCKRRKTENENDKTVSNRYS